MARGHGRILSSIWDDPDFTGLTQAQQRMYLFLLSQPNVNHAGLLPITLKRWARKASGLEAADLGRQLDELVRAGYAAVDRDVDEVLVLGYFAHVGTARQPRLVAAAYDALAQSASPALRAIASAALSDAVAQAPAGRLSSRTREVLERGGWRCAYCGWAPGDPVPQAKSGRPLYRGLELDHIHPRALGGTDDPKNLQVLCSSCNASKGARI